MANMSNDNETQHQESLGSLLKRTRTKHKLTLEEVNEATKVHLRSLQALENDDFAALPAEVFVKGFIKLYAEFLGLDPEDTVRHYLSQEKDSQEAPLQKQPSPRDVLAGETLADSTSFFRKNSKVITVTFLMAILLLFYGLGVFFKTTETTNDPLTSPQAEDTSVSETAAIIQEEVAPQDDNALESDKPASSQTIPAAEKEQAPEETAPQPEKEAIKESPREPAEPSVIEVKDEVVSEPEAKEVKTSPLPKTVKVSTSPAINVDRKEQTGEYKYTLEAKFNEGSLVTITVDDQPQRQYSSQAGIVRVWKANEKIVLKLDNRKNVVLSLNGQVLDNLKSDEPGSPIRIPEDITDNQ